MRTPRSAAREVKRIATGLPVPSPKAKVDPPAVVTRRFPARINPSNAHRSNRSIGRLLPHQALNPAMPSTQLPSTGVEHKLVPSGTRAIKTKSFRRGNDLQEMKAEKAHEI